MSFSVKNECYFGVLRFIEGDQNGLTKVLRSAISLSVSNDGWLFGRCVWDEVRWKFTIPGLIYCSHQSDDSMWTFKEWTFMKVE